jgi:hypothetical protein
MIAIRGSEDRMRCSDGNSLPFWKIAHQKMVDLSCLPVIYIKIVQADSGFENQMIGSGLKLTVFSASGVSSDFFIWRFDGRNRERKTGEHYA